VVNITASESAKRLKAKYTLPAYDSDERRVMIVKIRDYLQTVAAQAEGPAFQERRKGQILSYKCNAPGEDPVIIKTVAEAGIRGLERIIGYTGPFRHKDTVSDLYNDELVLLTWQAAKDKSSYREGIDDETAKFCFAKAMYECQRGYCFNNEGKDTGTPDSHICVGGTFNKLIEQGQDYSVDCEIKRLDAFLAFVAHIIIEMRDHLAGQIKADEISIDQAKGIVADLAQGDSGELNKEIWEVIKPRVIGKMQEEGHRQSKIDALVDNIESLNVKESLHPSMEKQLDKIEMQYETQKRKPIIDAIKRIAAQGEGSMAAKVKRKKAETEAERVR
jgi:hypothetical protein